MGKPRLHCWWNGVHVAEFERVTSNGATLRCQYSNEALERWAVNTPLLSCSLPVQQKKTRASNFLRGLLPEGQHLQDMASAAGVTTVDTYGLLARYGRDCAGALIITPNPEPPNLEPGHVEPFDDNGFVLEVDGLDTNSLGLHDDSELSIAGLQNKLLLVRLDDGRWGRPVHGYPSTHILKAEDRRFPGLIHAEAACLDLAHKVRLADNPPEVVTVNQRDCIIVTRYDRTVTDGQVRRVHQEDACQALNVDINAERRKGKYERYGGPSLAAVANLVDVHAEDRDHELNQLARHVTYTVVIGNGDWHGKNLSLLHDSNGRIRLAPVYDTVPTRLITPDRSPGAVSVAGVFNLDHIGVEQIVNEAHQWGLNTRDSEQTVTETIEELLEAARDIDHEAVANMVTTRAERLLADSASHPPADIAAKVVAKQTARADTDQRCQGVYSNGRRCTNKVLQNSNYCGRPHGAKN